MKKIFYAGALILLSSISYGQVTVTANPEKDNSIYSESENSNGLGKLYSATTCDGNFRRALLEFDIAGSIPAGATIAIVSPFCK